MKIKPVAALLDPTEERSKKRSYDFICEKFKKIDSRIQAMMLQKFLSSQSSRLYKQLEKDQGEKNFFSLFQNFLRSHYNLEKMQFPQLYENRKNAIKNDADDIAPIGIYGYFDNNWINSLIQFIIFSPNLRLSFDFAPKKLAAFTKFIDLYEKDRQQKKTVTTANSLILLRTLETLPLGFLSNKIVNFHEVLKKLFAAIYPDYHFSSQLEEGIDLLAFHPERMLYYDGLVKKSLEEHIDFELQKEKKLPPEFILCCDYNCFLDKKIYPKKNISFCKTFYQADSFIEVRKECDNFFYYFTYLKIGTSWYQCDDERVSEISSNVIKVPMRNGVLIHYKKKSMLKKILQ